VTYLTAAAVHTTGLLGAHALHALSSRVEYDAGLKLSAAAARQQQQHGAGAPPGTPALADARLAALPGGVDAPPPPLGGDAAPKHPRPRGKIKARAPPLPAPRSSLPASVLLSPTI
jgi:hypothetical protein